MENWCNLNFDQLNKISLLRPEMFRISILLILLIVATGCSSLVQKIAVGETSTFFKRLRALV